MLSHKEGAFENLNLRWGYLKHYYGSSIKHQTRANICTQENKNTFYI